MSKNRTHAVALGSHDLFWEAQRVKLLSFLLLFGDAPEKPALRAEQRSESWHDSEIARNFAGESGRLTRLGGELLMSSSWIE